MHSLQQVQDMLERMLGTYPMPAHYYFWRGKTRDELVAADVYGIKILVPDQPDESNLLRAMRGDGSGKAGDSKVGFDRLRRIFQDVRASKDDVNLLDAWIREGCPEAAPLAASKRTAAAAQTLDAAAAATDDTHIRYWAAIDSFFLPQLASPTTRPKVLTVHAFDNIWGPVVVAGAGNLSAWTTFLAKAANLDAFNYIRLHQRRLIQEYYGDSKSDLLDSLWKFGGNVLPEDPTSPSGLPNHTMNGVRDWFSWAPYLDASLRAPDVAEADLNLARGWQIGIVGDGLFSNYKGRDSGLPGARMPIADFNKDDPDVRSKVFAKYADADAPTLIGEMVRRAKDTNFFAAVG